MSVFPNKNEGQAKAIVAKAWSKACLIVVSYTFYYISKRKDMLAV